MGSGESLQWSYTGRGKLPVVPPPMTQTRGDCKLMLVLPSPSGRISSAKCTSIRGSERRKFQQQSRNSYGKNPTMEDFGCP